MVVPEVTSAVLMMGLPTVVKTVNMTMAMEEVVVGMEPVEAQG